MKKSHYIKLFLLVIIASFVTNCSLINKSVTKTNQKFASYGPYDAIIVPGFPHEEEKWSPVVKMRVLWAQKLYEKGLAKNIIFSGAAVYSPYIESKVMAEYAIALGVPAKNVFTEESAQHSTENLYFSYVRAKELGFEKVALATDPFQTFSLRSFRKKYNLDVGLLPIIFSELENFEEDIHPEIDIEDYMVDNFIPLDEIENFSERWQGTLGNQIKWREEDLQKKRHIKIKRKKGRLIPSKEFVMN